MARMFRIASSPPVAFLIVRLNLLIQVMTRFGPGTRHGRYSRAERAAYRSPFPDAASRSALVAILRDIRDDPRGLRRTADGLARLADRPLLLLPGERDNGHRAGWTRRWQAAFPRHRTVVMDGAGHFPHDEVAERMALEIEAWRRELVAS